MCGICGIVGPAVAARTAHSEAGVRRMMAALAHRGPDDEGLLVDPPVAFGMRRLSIIDLAGGRQPVFNEDGSVGVVLNGEIYNYQHLRAVLESLGHRFRTHSDTETVVHAYEQWGTDCVRYLRGMFAFAVVERARDDSRRPLRVLLARDRLGIKPLYYTLVEGNLLFASEVRALLASGWMTRRLNPTALESYLLFGSVGEPETLLEGIYSLPPGETASIPLYTEQPVTLQTERYWSAHEVAPRAISSPRRRRTLQHVHEQVREALEQSVRLHLLADVPVGIFLSSGLDSTAVAALAARLHPGIHTFTVVFPEADYSESALAQQIARHLQTTHRELILTGEEMLAHVDAAVAALDQPSMNGINTYFVSWAVRQAGLKVALSGLGGDEVFGGYRTFHSAPWLERLGRLANLLPGTVRAALTPLLQRATTSPDAQRKLLAAWRNPGMLPHPFYFARLLFAPEQVGTLLRDAGASDSTWRRWLGRAAAESAGWDAFSRTGWLEMRSYLVNTLLRDTDAMSMAHSLEVRVPLLDHVLVETVTRLPAPTKRRPGRPKALLVESLGALLPAEVVRQPKRTFTLPWEHWLRGPLQENVAAHLQRLTPALKAALNEWAVRQVWEEFLARRTLWSRPWSLFVLNAWVQRHIESNDPAGSARPD
ncbi:MAG: asparagine synthase (glutamine-hydrolyzing) [Firmicutes bacterium]|nr:asparagine synthase (glutamine-hydrolyzing) [Bacillota bacterium]